MRVKFLTSVSTSHMTFSPGTEYDLPELLAGQWAKAGYVQVVTPLEPVAVEPVAEPTPEPEAPAPRTRRKRTRSDEDML